MKSRRERSTQYTWYKLLNWQLPTTSLDIKEYLFSLGFFSSMLLIFLLYIFPIERYRSILNSIFPFVNSQIERLWCISALFVVLSLRFFLPFYSCSPAEIPIGSIVQYKASRVQTESKKFVHRLRDYCRRISILSVLTEILQ